MRQDEYIVSEDTKGTSTVGKVYYAAKEVLEMNWLQKQAFKLKTGANIQVFNDGKPSDEYIIRFKDIYISVLEGEDDYSVGWADTPTMFHVPVREFWTAHPPKSIPNGEKE